MKITLINPPSPFLSDERVFPYLGIINTATIMHQDGHDVDIVDLSGDADWEATVRELPKADVFGITSTSAQFKFAYQINKIVRKKGATILGGPHANNVTENDTQNYIDLLTFDKVLRGDGERYQEAFKTQKQVVDAGIVKHLDDIPMPDRSLIDIDSYKYTIDGKKATTILTQRGCPYKCNFCSGRNNPIYGRSRQHSPERIGDELEMLNDEFGFEGFMWFDDEININPRRLKAIADEIEGQGYVHRGFLRSDLLLKHPEQLEDLARMGFKELCLGVESGSDRILELLNKGATSQMAVDAVNLIKSYGIRTKAFTMIGHPTETPEDARRTRDLIVEMQPDGFDIALMQPYPGSIMYENAVPTKKFKNYGFQYKGIYFNKPRFSQAMVFHKGIPGTYTGNVRTDAMDSDEIIELRDKLETEVKQELCIK